MKQQQSLIVFALSWTLAAASMNAAPVVCKGVIREVDHLSRIKLVESAGWVKECPLDIPKNSFPGDQILSAGDLIEFTTTEVKDQISGGKVTRFRMPVDARIDSIDVENGRVRIRKPTPVRSTDTGRVKSLFPEEGGIVFAGTAMRQSQPFKRLAEGDRIRITIGVTPADRATAEIEDVRPLRVSDIGTGSGRAFWFLAAGAGVVGLVALIASSFSPLLLLFVGIDNKASKSKTQLSFWMIMVFAVLLATVFCRACFGLGFTGSIAMPTNLALLAGISGISFISAKAIRTKAEKASPTAAADKPAVSDLVTDEKGKHSLGDTQMLLVAAVAIIIYVLQAHEFLASMELTTAITLPDIDGSIATLFGVSQGAYIGNKAAS